jgi:AcrR family transcriptional regulator
MIAAEEGWSAVTVRAVAKRINCSAPAIYQYFRDKDAVLSALAAEGRFLLDDVLSHAVVGLSGPSKRLRAMLRAFWEFADQRREFYAVMFGLDGQAAHHERSSVGLAPEALVRASADLLAKRGGDEDPRDLADRLVATIHGFAGLAAADQFPGGRERAFDSLAHVFNVLLKDVGA